MSAGRKIKSLSQDWCTPIKYVQAIKEMFGTVELDPCSNLFSKIEAIIKYQLPNDNGLKKTWNYKTIYVNPPYGRDYEKNTTIKDWLKNCFEANIKYESEVIALIPVATNTNHWKNFIFGKAQSICFLYDTRLKFSIEGSEDNKGRCSNGLLYGLLGEEYR